MLLIYFLGNWGFTLLNEIHNSLIILKQNHWSLYTKTTLTWIKLYLLNSIIMSNNININDNNWIDIVFENRNHAYGAYQIRKDFNKNSLFGLLGMLAFLGGAFVLIMIFTYVKDEFVEKNSTEIPIVKPKDYDKIVLVEQPIFEEFEKKIEEFTKSVKFTEYKVVPDQQVGTSSIASIEEIKSTNIGLTTNTSGTDIIIPTGSTSGSSGTSVSGSAEPLLSASKMPEFPGGEQALLDFVYKNSQYTKLARENNVSGTLYASFVVNENGEVVSEKIERGLGFGMDEMVLNVLQKIPNFTPAEQNGRNVSIKMNLPIRFQLRNY